MFESLFSEYYAARAISAIGRLPKEVVYSGAAVLAVTEVARRYTQMKTQQTETNAKVRLEELAVEKLALELEMFDRKGLSS